MGKIIFKVPESKHPFVGLGEGIIIAENGKVEPKITVTFPAHSIEIITMTGKDAKLLISQMNSDEVWNEDKIEYAKNKVCEILCINPVKLYVSRDEKAAFGRWMVWEYANKILNMTPTQCAEIFNMSHSTVHCALGKIEELKEKNMKYMAGWQQFAYISFQEEMKKYSQIFEM